MGERPFFGLYLRPPRWKKPLNSNSSRCNRLVPVGQFGDRLKPPKLTQNLWYGKNPAEERAAYGAGRNTPPQHNVRNTATEEPSLRH